MIRNKIKIVVAIYLLLNLTGLKIFGQISTDERPISFNYDENMFKTRSENLRTMPTIDLEALETKYNFLMKKCYFSIFLIVFFITNRRGANMVTYNIANIPRKILRKVCNANATAARNAAKNILLVATSFIFIVIFSSCKEDPPVPPVTEVHPIVNVKWQLFAQSKDRYWVNGKPVETTEHFVWDPVETQAYMELLPNGATENPLRCYFITNDSIFMGRANSFPIDPNNFDEYWFMDGVNILYIYELSEDKRELTLYPIRYLSVGQHVYLNNKYRRLEEGQ